MNRRICSVLLALLLIPCIVPNGSAAPAEEEPVNILLIGHDREPGDTLSRSDSIILCTWLPETGMLSMISFLRDLYLPIPGHGSNRLNAAYAIGGRELLVQTLEQNFGVTIEGCVEVDFIQFAQIIDALDGVELELRQDEALHINRKCGGSLTEGLQTLNGQEALAYARIRSLDPDGDFSRTRRQRDMLLSLLRRWKDANTLALAGTVGKLLPLVSTDLDPARILHWVFSMAPSMGALRVQSLQLPFPGTFSEEIVNGMAVLVPDIAANRKKLQEKLFG